jgi:hypothetical protein
MPTRLRRLAFAAPMHFEALLVKKEAEWLMVMEYQKQMATEQEWDAAEN